MKWETPSFQYLQSMRLGSMHIEAVGISRALFLLKDTVQI